MQHPIDDHCDWRQQGYIIGRAIRSEAGPSSTVRGNDGCLGQGFNSRFTRIPNTHSLSHAQVHEEADANSNNVAASPYENSLKTHFAFS